jgi:hypothetical protein
MTTRAVVCLVGLLVLALAAASGLAQENRLDPPVEDEEDGPPGAGPPVAQNVLVCVTDNLLYGFCQPAPGKTRRLGNVFTVMVFPDNGTVSYRVLVDKVVLSFPGGDTVRVVEGQDQVEFSIPTLRRGVLQVELLQGDSTHVLDFGSIRFRAIADLDDDVKDDPIRDVIEEQFRIFTAAEWTWFHIRWAGLGVLAVILGLYAGWQKGREEERHEEPTVFGF